MLDPATKRLKNSNTVCFNGKPLKADLERALKVNCCVANDANCFALAEHCCGAARGQHSSFGVIMGTGVGGGGVAIGIRYCTLPEPTPVDASATTRRGRCQLPA